MRLPPRLLGGAAAAPHRLARDEGPLRRRQPPAVRQVGAALARASRRGRSTSSSCTRASTTTPSCRRSSSTSSASRSPPTGSTSTRPIRDAMAAAHPSTAIEARAARLGARLRRHELDARRRAGGGRRRLSRSRTSRPGCAAATCRCPRSGTGSRSTALAQLLLAPDERSRATLEAEGVAGRIEVVGDVMRDALDLFAPIARARSTSSSAST